MPETLRVTKGTYDQESFAPDGSHRFPEGLIVEVGEGHGQVSPLTARRWRRAGFVEDYEGHAGQRVTNEDAGMSSAEAAAQIGRLQAIHAQAVARESGRTAVENARTATVMNRAMVPERRGDYATGSPEASLADAERAQRAQAEAGVPADRAAGDAPYKDPDAGDPWGEYDLTDQQRESLAAAGFAHPDQVRDADPGDLLGLRGIGPATVAKLRGGQD